MAPDSRVWVAILQPSYLPWLGYFDMIQKSDVFVLYDDVQYDKHGWRNRNRIRSPNGWQWLTVPVRTGGRSEQRICDVEVDNHTPWPSKHLRAIEWNYKKSPYLDRYLPSLRTLYEKPWEKLVDLNIASIELLGRLLGLSGARLERSSRLGIQGERSERLLKICQHFKAQVYFPTSAARAYLDETSFRKAGVEVVYQDYSHPVYPQVHGEFVSHLSAVDLLLNCGPQSLGILLDAGQRGSRPVPEGEEPYFRE